MSTKSKTTVPLKVSKSLDKLINFLIENPKLILAPAPLIGLLKGLINFISFLHSVDCEKASTKWMLVRIIPITLYLWSFYKFGKKIISKLLDNKALKLSVIQYIGFCIAIMGHILRWWSNHVMRHEFTFILVADGPYKYVRHPRYAAVYLYGFGDCLLLQNTPIYIAFVVRVLLYPQRIKKEEKLLIEFFGDDYKTYKQCVKYKLIPGVY